jgi:hypothetical protein
MAGKERVVREESGLGEKGVGYLGGKPQGLGGKEGGEGQGGGGPSGTKSDSSSGSTADAPPVRSSSEE